MFGRKKKASSRAANRLSNEAEPNVLSPGVSGSADGQLSGDAADSDLLDEDDAGTGEKQQRAASRPAERDRQGERSGLTKDDPKALYGPNGEAVASLLAALDGTSGNQVTEIAGSWAAVKPSDRQIAQMMARRLRADRRLDSPLRAAEGQIRGWLAAQLPAHDEEASQYGEAADAALDAVAALILDEELNDADFATLYGPWSDVMDVVAEADDDEYEEEPDEEPEGEDVEDEEDFPDGEEATDDELLEGDQEDAEGEGDAKGKASAEKDFGPNADLVRELLARLEDLSPEQARRLSSTWGATDQDALTRAQAALEDAIDADPDSRDEVKRAQAVVVGWASPQPTTRKYGTGDRTVRTRQRAAPAVLDAVAALAMVDALSREDAATLYAPWAAEVGKPELPVFEEDEPS